MKINKLRIDEVDIDISDTVLIIGGNNSGKTKFLQSIHDEFIGLTEWEGAEYSRSTYRENYWPNMLKAGFFEFSASDLDLWAGAQEKWKVKSDGPQVATLYRSNKHILQWQGHEASAIDEQSYNDLKSNTRSNPPVTELRWILPFKQSHTQEMSVDQRFNDSNGLSSINIVDENAPYVLYTNNNVLQLINKHLVKLFKRKLQLIMTAVNTYAFLVVDLDNNSLPSWPNSSKPDQLVKTATKHKLYYDQHREEYIGEQSHGTRAFLSLLMALSDKTRKILFIDEPELHLYPIARRYVANLIAINSKSRQVFMVTHDPLIVDGISLSRKDFTIIKINRDRKIKIVNFNQAERRRTSSELKNTQAVRAGFLDSALFVEGISDKYVYGSIIDRKKMINSSIEYGIIDCGGNDKVVDHIKFAYDIGTKVTVIVDFDTIYDLKNRGSRKIQIILPILEALDLPQDLISEVEALRPILASNKMRVSGINTVGLTQDAIDSVVEVLDKLSAKGVFVVPCGELYDWFEKRKLKKEISPEWLRNKYYNKAKDFPDLTAFLEKVTTYLNT